MATKAISVNLDRSHFLNFQQYLNTTVNWDQATIDQLLNLGCIQVSSAFEQAIANVSGYTVISEDAADMSDGSDAKLSTVRLCSRGKVYAAKVDGIKNKTGLLRVQVYERKQNNFFYFVFPPNSYAHIPGSSNIEIPFNLDGSPKRVNKTKVNWWDWQVPTFHAMATWVTK